MLHSNFPVTIEEEVEFHIGHYDLIDSQEDFDS